MDLQCFDKSCSPSRKSLKLLKGYGLHFAHATTCSGSKKDFKKSH